MNDQCNTCAPGYGLGIDKVKCLLEVLNCETYAFDHTETSLICSKCERGFVLSGNVCEPGQVSNCELYSSSSCAKCENGFYLDSGACVAHTAISLCDIYSIDEANTCSQCDNDAILISQEVGCKEMEKIDNCKTYRDSSCYLCESFY